MGVFRGASAWLGADHVLLVSLSASGKSISAIICATFKPLSTADAPRFHSPFVRSRWRCSGCSLTWSPLPHGACFRRVGRLGAWNAFPACRPPLICGSRQPLLIRAWAIISGGVQLPLPHLYRRQLRRDPLGLSTWTARRFVCRNWSRLSRRPKERWKGTGPKRWRATRLARREPCRRQTSAPVRLYSGRPPRPWAAYAFIASLLAGGAADFLLLRYARLDGAVDPAVYSRSARPPARSRSWWPAGAASYGPPGGFSPWWR